MVEIASTAITPRASISSHRRQQRFGSAAALTGTPVMSLPHFDIGTVSGGGLFASGIGMLRKGLHSLSKNVMLELVAMDLAAFTVPRSLVETVVRGPIMGFETLIRETGGLFSNTFSCGWAGHLFTRLFEGLLLTHASRIRGLLLMPSSSSILGR